ncbi:uncharacterized protein LOC110177084 isoform X2 [Drosophila serrata]|uniref:uncharacterized protein LOC110177084 isoform X2 n=1 Tax=Drosophila serrata TaxID=7274 RepID=UPI000A1D30E7|nr:uncharacterized protein LOC110177084 isoform X2 [Drosophila serrata]
MALNKRINPTPEGLPGVTELNYKFACRCCLKADAEFIKLDSVSVARSLDPASEEDKISLLRCLVYCVRADNAPELPQYICIECSQSLQVAYYFLQNAVRAHEILCRKLCPSKFWNAEGRRFNGAIGRRFQPSPSPRETATTSGDRTRPPKSMRQECQVCGDIFNSRMELKQHLRQHTDGISYHCKMCNFTTLKQRQLLDHYRFDHAMPSSQAEEHVKASPMPIAPIKEDEVKAVCTLEDMELLIPTVLTPDDYVQPTIDSEQLRDLEQHLAASMGDAVTSVDSLTSTLPPMDTAHNVSIGTEYLVLPDGSLQQINGGGVVIEYIDDSKPQKPPPPPPNPPHVNVSLQNLLGPDDDAMDIDVSELIVEDMMAIHKPTISTAVPNPVKPKPTVGSQNYKHKCSICPRTFSSMPRLKSHQLTHSNLPKFFCDQCDFYSLRSVDLIEHYKTTHHRVDENGSTSHDPGSEETGVYSCDMCLFETRTCSQLRVHYTNHHGIQPTEVQLRPSWTNNGGNETNNKELSSIGRQPEPADLPVAIKYPPLVGDSQVPVEVQAPVQQPVLVQQQPVVVTTPTTLYPQTSNNINVVVDTTPLFYASTTSSTVQAGPVPVQTMQMPVQTMPVPTVQTMPMPVQVMPVLPQATTVMESANENNSNAFDIQNPFPKILPSNEQENEAVPVDSISTANTSNISMFGDMQDFIDNTDVAAICTIPADDMPVVDGDDIVIDNNNISLDFDADNLFEEFEEEDDAVGEDEGEEEEEEDEADNDDENDNNDAATDQNLLLTSDDDDVDDFDDEQSKHLQKPYCIYCNKKFTSQYKFENHMFVHRGLAPYRCELCTNLYNMKRLLIRHYKTVHKRMPTRDMVQAKGDKVLVARTNIEKLYLDGIKSPMVMCAKCPYECEADGEMRKHLNAHHGINDGLSIHANEVFIIRKLPFECPRCIRSFAAKGTLTRHLQRSHMVDTIIEMQAAHSSSATTTITTTTASIAGPVGDRESIKDEMMMTTTTAAAGNVLGRSQDDVTATGAPVKKSCAVSEEDVDPVTLDAATAATTAAIAAAISSASASPSTTTASGPSASNLYPTPTPFDFDYDLMGSDAQRSQVSTPTSNPQFGSSGSGLLNGSDKLLTTAAMSPFPTKGLRSNRRQAHSSIYMCKLCNKSFDELGKLVKHEMEMHSNTEPSRWGYQHKCSICSTSYRTLTLLKFHMKRHVNRKSQCKLCPKIFATNAELERHMKVKHCREKLIGPCAIDGCGKMFAFKHHMVRHQNASHLKSRHICEVCNKELLTVAHLKSHMSLHKNMVTYRCPECDRPYLRRGRLLSHLLKIHKKRLTEEEITVLFSGIKEDPSPPQSPTHSPPQSPNDLKMMTRKGQLGLRKSLEVDETVDKEETRLDADSAAEPNLSK